MKRYFLSLFSLLLLSFFSFSCSFDPIDFEKETLSFISLLEGKEWINEGYYLNHNYNPSVFTHDRITLSKDKEFIIQKVDVYFAEKQNDNSYKPSTIKYNVNIYYKYFLNDIKNSNTFIVDFTLSHYTIDTKDKKDVIITNPLYLPSNRLKRNTFSFSVNEKTKEKVLYINYPPFSKSDIYK